jgi:hypothetical protein
MEAVAEQVHRRKSRSLRAIQEALFRMSLKAWRMAGLYPGVGGSEFIIPISSTEGHCKQGSVWSLWLGIVLIIWFHFHGSVRGMMFVCLWAVVVEQSVWYGKRAQQEAFLVILKPPVLDGVYKGAGIV